MTDGTTTHDAGLSWQVGVWDRMTPVYEREVDVRFVPVVDQLMLRGKLAPGQRVVDVGTGTGAVALRCAPLVPGGEVIGVDISPQMLDIARQRVAAAKLENVTFVDGRAEELPFEDHSVDRVFASLSLMYALDRPAAAREFARVLRPGGRVVAAVWAGPEHNDIVRFQMMAGSFAPEPPVPGVGPGSMANGAEFGESLERAGIRATLETETPGFTFDTFEHAWDVLVGVTTANMDPHRQDEARAAVREAMWPADGGPRYFSNLTQYIVGELAG
jgi:SAM-dependent methyltransferase